MRSAANTPIIRFDTRLARELTTFENEPTLEQALKWRLSEACHEIDRLRAVLEQIVACDYRGNEPHEQRLAREALGG